MLIRSTLPFPLLTVLSLAAALPIFSGCSSDDAPLGTPDDGTGTSDSTSTGDGDGDPTTGDPSTGDGDGDPTTGDGDGDPTTGDAPCLADADCSEPAAPFCDLPSGSCVACDGLAEPDLACAGLDASMPLCSAGACVACTEADASLCAGPTPICDLASNACVGCSRHDQCPDSACNLAAGNCIDPAAILHVDGDAITCDDAGDGSEATPYCTLAEALIDAPPEALLRLTGMANGKPYLAAHTVTGTKVVLGLPSAGDAWPRVVGTNSGPAMTVAPTANLIARDVWFVATPAGHPGVHVDQGQAWLEAARVFANTGVGLRVDAGEAHVDASRFSANSGGAVVVEAGGALTVRNSFVASDLADVSTIHVVEGAATLRYVTIGAGLGNATALACAAGQPVTVANSLLFALGDNDELQCPGATVTGSALELDLAGNLALGPVNPDWFTAVSAGDLHLAGSSPAPAELATAAAWAPGDPATDIDGDLRPTEPGPDYAGADLP